MNTLKRAAELLRQDASAIGQLTKLSGTDDRINEMVLVAALLERMAQPGRIDGVDSNPPGLLRFFAYDNEVGFERFNTEVEAKKFVQDSIDEYRGEAAEGWPEEVENICWGVVLGTTQEVQIADSEGNTTDLSGDRYVDYTLTDFQQFAKAAAEPAAWMDVLNERRRQMDVEGWTPEHDDAHENGEIATAAICYVLYSNADTSTKHLMVPQGWPWDYAWWKPTTPRRDLVKAAALLLAEIERIDRAMLAADTEPGSPSLCSDCARADVSCPIYPQDTQHCVEYRKKQEGGAG
ncbi:hypothetical protein A9J41_12950 [Laribacter hongkongensis]|uniref:hypothetical protein n=1 Tax=Laribacter hongkongensis TaxID=168471 RepID=UPI001878BA17|nr:hypothetical protein [Laribacter hongkongensis]MBE5528411.1 hypothetical protein [Laribacter hongkongensis]